jgi:hypothetical protein
MGGNWMFNKRRLTTLLSVLAIAVAGAGYMLRAQTSTHKIGRTPVTVTYEFTPKVGPKQHETHYYRSDGSFALSVLMEGDTKAPPVDVFDLANKREFLKDPATGLMDEFALTKRTYDLYRHIPMSCEAAILVKDYQTCEPLGNDEVLGYPVQKMTLRNVRNKPGATFESLVAPGLDFLPLVQYQKQDGKIETTRRAISIKIGEPDEFVFALPPNYRKVENSSEFITAGEIVRGRNIPFTAESQPKFDQAQREKKTQSEIHKVQ